MFMKGQDRDVEGMYARAYKVDERAFDKNNDVHLSFMSDQLTQRARDFIANQRKVTVNWVSPSFGYLAIINDLANAKTPGNVANLLTKHSSPPGNLAAALSDLQMGINRDTPLPGTITARNKNA
ncbi:hypothetical protein F0U60_47080 [Archangium minus]|uniref:Uncharacterized protein n=1 Tax=Archangium minus TaxID=83450 RepID=A0ABY9X667_9BACT|nr:hypothetical protein F0U60_47080 [Archangium minus]